MKDYFTLLYTFNLTKFIVKIYNLKSASSIVSIGNLTELTASIEAQEYPRGIAELLKGLDGVDKIEIFDYDNQKLLGMQVFVK